MSSLDTALLALQRQGELPLSVVGNHCPIIVMHAKHIFCRNTCSIVSEGFCVVRRLQAVQVAERLRGIPFTAVFVSDLARTLETAKPIIGLLPTGTPVFRDARLREKGGGESEGQPIEHLERMAQLHRVSPRVYRPVGGESWDDVRLRSKHFLGDIVSRFCPRPAGAPAPCGATGEGGAGPVPCRLLLVTHGGFLSELFACMGFEIGNSTKNCSLTVVGVTRQLPAGLPAYTLRLRNCVQHVSSPE